MKAIVLAAGYAVRLYPLTKDKPKPLLEVKGKTILDHIIGKIEELNVDQIFVVTNNKFYQNFEDWLKTASHRIPIKIINDHTTSNEDRKGAIGDIHYVISQEQIDDDLLIIAGDNLFNFSLKEMENEFAELRKNMVALYDVGLLERAKKFGIAELDGNGKMIDFVEKPENPSTTLAATCIYFFPRETIALIDKYLKENNNPDAPGYLIAWLYKNSEVFGKRFTKKWFDIGSFEGLEKARNEFKTDEPEVLEQEPEEKPRKPGEYF